MGDDDEPTYAERFADLVVQLRSHPDRKPCQGDECPFTHVSPDPLEWEGTRPEFCAGRSLQIVWGDRKLYNCSFNFI